MAQIVALLPLVEPTWTKLWCVFLGSFTGSITHGIPVSSVSPPFIAILIEASGEGIYFWAHSSLYSLQEQHKEDTKIASLYEKVITMRILC